MPSDDGALGLAEVAASARWSCARTSRVPGRDPDALLSPGEDGEGTHHPGFVLQ